MAIVCGVHERGGTPVTRGMGGRRHGGKWKKLRPYVAPCMADSQRLNRPKPTHLTLHRVSRSAPNECSACTISA